MSTETIVHRRRMRAQRLVQTATPSCLEWPRQWLPICALPLLSGSHLFHAAHLGHECTSSILLPSVASSRNCAMSTFVWKIAAAIFLRSAARAWVRGRGILSLPAMALRVEPGHLLPRAGARWPAVPDRWRGDWSRFGGRDAPFPFLFLLPSLSSPRCMGP